MCVDGSGKPTCDGFCYQDRVCVKKILGICFKKEVKIIDKIAMNMEDKILCSSLFNMNFVLKVREKPL